MDPVSHIAAGYIAVRSTRTSVPRLALAACIGALAPDADAVLMTSWDVYLRMHQIGTHALVASAPLACCVALAIRGRHAIPLPPLFVGAWLGVLSHLVLDIVSGARIRPFWPFLDSRTALPLVSMADPWLLIPCCTGALGVAWMRSRARRAARVALVVITLGLAVKAVWLVQALQTLRADAIEPVVARVIEGRWAALREWTVLLRTPTSLSRHRISPGRPPLEEDRWPIASDFPLAERSWSLETVRNLRAVHELSFAREHPSGSGTTEVLWSDLRFCWRPAPDEDSTSGPLTLGHNQDRIRCAIWAGGAFDSAGRAINQRVQVFGLWQTRRVSR